MNNRVYSLALGIRVFTARFKTISYLAWLLILVFSVGGCGVSREEHQAENKRIATLEKDLERLKEDVAAIKRDSAQLSEVKGRLEKLAGLPPMPEQSITVAHDNSIRTSCQNNLRMIDAAVDLYAQEHKQRMVSSMSQIVGTNAYIISTPVCKGGGTYTLPYTLGGKTSCSIHGSTR